ncbi:MAG: urease accessory UreF family protein [Pseudomonadota bacterium]
MTAETLRLMAWLSPAYPVGAYTYSHGLEWAVSSESVFNTSTAMAWIADALQHGSGRNDAILLAHAWRAAGDPDALAELAELAAALAPSAERLLETQAQGAAFADVTEAAWNSDHCRHAPYPVALGAAAGQAGIDLHLTTATFLQAFVSNLVSAAIRLVPLGQTDGQRIIAELLPCCQQVAEEGNNAHLDELGGSAVLADIASMRHETQEVRLFRS